MPSISLSGFPEVVRFRISQYGDGTPGRCVVECLPTTGTKHPTETTLVASDDTTTCTWSGMRVIRIGRVRGGIMRVVLEDSLWKLGQFTLGDNLNRRDASGNLFGDFSDVSGLCSVLASASGLSITSGTIPGFEPPAEWNGKDGLTALQDMLRDAVCRIHYNPVTQVYTVSASGSGLLPNLDNRMFNQGPARTIRNLQVVSSPTMYEDPLPVRAVVEKATNVFEDLDQPQNYFGGFPGVPDNAAQRRYQQSAFRLWRYNADTDKDLLPHRAVSLLHGPQYPAYMGARLLKSQMFRYMEEDELVPYDGYDPSVSDGGTIFYREDPFLTIGGGGTIAIDATVLCAYHLKDANGKHQRVTKTRVIDATMPADKEICATWIRPIVASEPDVPASVWDALHDEVANAHQQAFNKQPQTAKIPGLAVPASTGRVSGQSYRFNTNNRTGIETVLAFDFDATGRIC